MKKNKNDVSRRAFITKASLLMGGAGLAASSKFELLNSIAAKLIPHSYAEDEEPSRLIDICLRSGVPMIGLGVSQAFANNVNMRYSNSPFNGNQYTAHGNGGLFLTPFSEQFLGAHADNFAVTQNVMLDPGQGHISMFMQRRSPQGSPIIQLANANPTASTVHGIQMQRNPGAGDVQNDVKAGSKDLVKVNMNTFKNLFQKPSFYLSDNEAAAITEAATKLSRRQALLLENKVKDIVNKSRDVASAASLMNVDLSQQLDVGDIQGNFVDGGGPYGQDAQGMATILKAMRLNLLNSAVLVMTTGDWHGDQQPNSARVRNTNVALAKMLGAAAAFMKATVDPASPTGKTLWDTTTIVGSSEFTRGVNAFGQDNSDSGTNGMFFLGGKVKSGFVGDYQLGGGGGQPMGVNVDGSNGNSLLNNRHLVATVNKLCNNPSTDTGMVITKIA